MNKLFIVPALIEEAKGTMIKQQTFTDLLTLDIELSV